MMTIHRRWTKNSLNTQAIRTNATGDQNGCNISSASRVLFITHLLKPPIFAYISNSHSIEIMLLKVHPENPSQRQILKVCEVIRKGGVVVYPTDTVYALGCDIYNTRAVDRIARLKGTRVNKADFSFIFSDLSQLSDYTRLVSNSVFKLMKAYLPGPYTFILPARNNIPRIFHSKKKTIGIRIPDNNIPLEIVRELGHPIMTTSIHDEDELIEYTTDPVLIWDKFKDEVDAVINGGYGNNEASTVIDCTNEEPVILRLGIGKID